MRTIQEIIEAAGGAKGISDASEGAITRDAVYKWPTIGIPERNWTVIIGLASSSAEELYQANVALRSKAATGDAA